MYATSPRQRTASALASFAIVGLGAAALVIGLSAGVPLPDTVRQTLVSLTPEQPEASKPRPKLRPVPVQAEKAQTSRKRNEASPKNLRNQATPLFAPVLPPLITPPPIVAAPLPAAGTASNTGASDRVGPGHGAGGIGNGSGGGGNGDGDGDGLGETRTRPIQTKGSLHWSDLPPDVRELRRGGELEVTYRIGIDGRVSECRVVRKSGYPTLDAQTCRLITERFRFRPSHDASGHPVASYMIQAQRWDRPPDDDTEGD